MKYPHCPNCKGTVVWYAFSMNVFMVIFKSVLALYSGCSALVADAFHSAADILASTVTMISMKISGKPADEDHVYGHGKIQFISSAIVGIILLTGAAFIIIGALTSIIKGDYSAPNAIALLGAGVSVIANELMYHYQSCVGRENNSPAIIANAWDNRSDAISSIAVMIGIGLAVFGFPIADPLAAAGVALVIIHIAVELIKDAIDGLMDASPEVEELREIYNVVRSVSGILGVSYMRARTIGDELHVELSVEVDGSLYVYEGDVIVDVLKKRIINAVDHIGGVYVFLTPHEMA
ncbi:MAG: magnetosome biogenesis CDF transporter MamB [Magnetococcales bacterium]|nr:magnetosome biogenesis CDF transporter MamB [Magnetococcales bacterium]MBF0148810.1 magnetosome biogenesis CDF transporter MamB [Magnetococcales bacterium]MBF0173410.1 magnetosome biogenesis CDF transporter MamB [Magnetococcales bacterium]MBF0346464.1 magnetosome biogenesis CDF transporter MamB [Magnetococcales bacterium]MBF0629855.1 magnetosome biogenesis CDF transporter MamB [Magnetococcales bacterium]